MKIAFVGASGYGNVGDDTYPLVFQKYFRKHELLFLNSDLPETLPEDISFFVFGGGGILHNAAADADGMYSAELSRHFVCMQVYLDIALARGIPYGFLSCGFQFPDESASDLSTLEPWVQYLKKAQFISLRSPECRRIAQTLTQRRDCLWYPDLGYLYHPFRQRQRRPEKRLTIVPSGAVTALDHDVQRMILYHSSVGYRIVWLGMGAAVDDAPHFAAVGKHQPAGEIIRCGSPQESVDHIRRSAYVITGRYHGMIFARSHGVPFYVPENSPHKIRSEALTAAPEAAAGHVETLLRALRRISA